MEKKKLVILLASLILILMLAMVPFVAACAKPAKPEAIIVATMPAGSPPYMTAIAQCELWKKHLGINASAMGIGGGVVTLGALYDKEANVCYTTSEHASHMRTGTWVWEGRKGDSRTLFTGYTTAETLITRADSGINSVADCKGKRCMFYSDSSPFPNMMIDALLEYNGMTRDDIKAMEYASAEADIAECLKEGTIDIGFFLGAPQKSWLLDLSNTIDIRIVGATEDEWNYMKEKFAPILARTTLKAGSYKGQDEEILTFGGKTIWVLVTPELPDDLVYDMFKTIDVYKEDFFKVHGTARAYTLENAADYEKWVVPVHPGVIKYMEEKDIWTANHDATQQKLLGK